MVYGKAYYINELGQTKDFYPVEPYSGGMLYRVNTICQPAAFFRKSAVDSLGGLDEDLYFCMDYDLWIRMVQRYPIGYIEDTLAHARIHPDCKNVKDWLSIGYPEVFQVTRKYYGQVSDYWVMEYIGNHIAKGGAWIMNRLKHYGIAGPSPQIVETNLYDDAWVPPLFRCIVHSDPGNPLHTVAIRGRHQMAEFFPDCGNLIFSIRLNGNVVLDRCVKEGVFILEIPVHGLGKECVIEIASEQAFVPADHGSNEDTRALSFVLEDIFPLSCREYGYYALLQRFG